MPATQPSLEFRLREVGVEDAGLIVQYRQQSERSRYIHPIVEDIDVQRSWIHADRCRDDSAYFAIEQGAEVHGFVGLVAIDRDNGSAEWGRWIVREGSLAAVPSAILIYDYGFTELGLMQMYCRTIADNASTVRFHDSCGARRNKVLERHFEVRGRSYDAIEHTVTAVEWPSLRVRLERLARVAER